MITTRISSHDFKTNFVKEKQETKNVSTTFHQQNQNKTNNTHLAIAWIQILKKLPPYFAAQVLHSVSSVFRSAHSIRGCFARIECICNRKRRIVDKLCLLTAVTSKIFPFTHIPSRYDYIKVSKHDLFWFSNSTKFLKSMAKNFKNSFERRKSRSSEWRSASGKKRTRKLFWGKNFFVGWSQRDYDEISSNI